MEQQHVTEDCHLCDETETNLRMTTFCGIWLYQPTNIKRFIEQNVAKKLQVTVVRMFLCVT